MAGFGTLFQALQALLPPWALAIVGLVFAVWLVRGFRFRTRSRQIRGLIRRRVRASPLEAEALLQHAFRVAGDDPTLLGELAREARRRTQPDGWLRAMARLEQVPGGPPEVARVRRLEGLEVRALDVHEEADRIENLLDQGLADAARVRLAEAQARFPHAERLATLAARAASSGHEDPGSDARMG